MKSKLKFILPLLLLLACGVTYQLVVAGHGSEPQPKIDGAVYVLRKDFLVNLRRGHFAKVSIALVLPHDAIPAEHGGGETGPPPEGYGGLEQEGAVRAVVTDEFTGRSVRELRSSRGRERIRRRLVRQLHRQTDVEAEEVLFTDVAVQ